MAYYTGSANDMEALRQALISACAQNGYALRGNILVKGNVIVDVQVVSGYLRLTGGTGVGANNSLAGASPAYAQIGPNATFALQWPVRYDIYVHANPDEVYLLANYSVDKYQYCAFGKSVIAGLPGTGCWYSASLNQSNSTNYQFSEAGNATYYYSQPGLYWRSLNLNYSATYSESFIHTGLDGGDWATGATDTAGKASAADAVAPLLNRLPSAWNSESVLMPIQPMVYRPQNKLSVVADLGHARYVRNDNHDPAQIVTIGQERWRIYPFFRKNSVERIRCNSTSNPLLAHSGTFGLAVRYDGP